jgi:FkbM family methyltransferase
MIIHSGSLFFENRADAVYDLLAHLAPGLMLDIGAAAGHFTQIMLARSPGSRILAVEPFAGNHPFFERSVGADARVTLVRKAASDRAGTVNFHVAMTVTGTEPGWEEMVGYSSAGKVTLAQNAARGTLLSVETCRVDSLVDEAVRFCKIDVQGHELAVLHGMSALLERRGTRPAMKGPSSG